METIIKIIADYKDMDPSQITGETHLVNDLGLDSLDTAELMMNFEDELGVTIELTEPVETVQQLCALVQAAQK